MYQERLYKACKQWVLEEAKEFSEPATLAEVWERAKTQRTFKNAVLREYDLELKYATEPAKMADRMLCYFVGRNYHTAEDVRHTLSDVYGLTLSYVASATIVIARDWDIANLRLILGKHPGGALYVKRITF